MEEEKERCFDPRLWNICAGNLVQLPPVNSNVCYFPQGHAEYCREELVSVEKIPPFIMCKVESINYFAHQHTEQVYAKIRLHPFRNEEDYDSLEDLEKSKSLSDSHGAEVKKEKVVLKSLSQSDVNLGPGNVFILPRYWLNLMFPLLDYSMKPPVQTITARDIHGQEWKFRHIYRETSPQHVLSTGWRRFVIEKKLVAGDSIVLVKSDDAGELRIGIRRKRKIKDEELWRRNNDAESLLSAVSHAVNGEKFEVVYYPRSNVPEFVVNASSVYRSTRIQWCQGLRFKMPFESPDPNSISIFMGTVLSVKSHDLPQFPNSPWRMLQVAWDDNHMPEEVEKVSPWSVELVSDLFSNHAVLKINISFDG